MSVVVASFRARPVLDACLAALLPQCATADVEVIVARQAECADLAGIAAAYPGVRVVAAPAGADLPRVRGAGLARASGALVALTEDHCRPAGDWIESLLTHVHNDADAIGGAMENGQPMRTIDWGAFFAEYGFFAGARPEDAAPGTAPALTGANVAYRRDVVARVAAWAADGAWENVVHARLAAEGAVLCFDPRLRVAQGLSYELTDFCRDRYQHGHDYARMRLAEAHVGNTARWLRAATAPALAPLLVWRVARRVRRTTGQTAFVAALPFTFAFLAAWSIGEAVGYARGPAR